MEKKNVLILSYSHLGADPRVKRQINALRDIYRIETAGRSALKDNTIPFQPIYATPPFSLLRKAKRFVQFIAEKFENYYWDDGKKQILKIFREKHFDVVIANDIQTLPLALAIADKKARVYFDAHEYHPKEFEDSWTWRLFYQRYVMYLCKKYLVKADSMSTVSEGIRKEYFKNFNVNPAVVTNATVYKDLSPTPVEDAEIRLIHHGAAIRGRKIEQMIQMMQYLRSGYSLDLMLIQNDTGYFESLERKASGNSRINFIAPVSQDEICRKINQYDIGVYILPPTSFNNLHALPNKFFDFIQARLCVAVSPSPEMAGIVSQYDLGVTAASFDPKSMADAIRCLTKEKIMYHKEQSHKHAMLLSAEENKLKICSLVKGN